MMKRVSLIGAVAMVLGLLLLTPTNAAAQCCDKACVDVDGDGAADDSIRCPGLILGALIPNPTNLRGCEELDPAQFCIGGRLLPPVVSLLAPAPPPPDHQGLLLAGCVCGPLSGTCHDGAGVSLTANECALAAASACGYSAIRQLNDPDCDPCAGVNCDDGNACTDDSCSAGQCVHTTVSCDDGDACTTDTCDPATGCSNTALSCDDGNPCTTDTCDPNTGCVHSGTCAAVCGNGIVEAGEQCDDGNTTNGDGCSSACTIEASGCCISEGVCFAASSCNGTPGGTFVPGGTCINNTCTPPGAVCGNGIVEGTEECDDGNTTGGDGCSLNCQDETPSLGCCKVDTTCTPTFSVPCGVLGGTFVAGGTCVDNNTCAPPGGQ